MTKKLDFINKTKLIFSDISSEKFREYTFPNKEKLTIFQPLFLNVSESGGHRIFSNNGCSYYIKPAESWYIMWIVKEGEPNFEL